MESKPLETAREARPDSRPPADFPAGAGTFFGFRVGGLGFLVSAEIYCEVLEQAQVNPLPNTQAWFGGLLNLRGNLVPVIDLHRLLGESVADPKKRRLFTLDKGEKAVALWIDGLPEVHGPGREPLEALPPLPAVLAPHVPWGYAYQGQAWLNVRFADFFIALGRQIALG